MILELCRVGHQTPHSGTFIVSHIFPPNFFEISIYILLRNFNSFVMFFCPSVTVHLKEKVKEMIHPNYIRVRVMVNDGPIGFHEY